MPTISWAKSADVTSGFLSTNLNSLTFHFTANVGNNSLETIMFDGKATGFSGMTPVFMIPRGTKLYYNDLSQRATQMRVSYLAHVNVLTVQFFPEVTIEGTQPIAELLVTPAAVVLPPNPVTGSGTFEVFH